VQPERKLRLYSIRLLFAAHAFQLTRYEGWSTSPAMLP
jgi:hypothetical protein